MGFFDLLTPALAFVDGAVSGLIPSFAVRTALWGVISGIFCMALYALLSNQQRLDEAKQRTATLRDQVQNFDGEYEDLQPLARELIKSALHQVRITFMPAVLASLPVLFLLAFMANYYSYAPISAGTLVTLTAAPDELVIEPAIAPDEAGVFTLPWPAEGASYTLKDDRGETIATLPAAGYSSVLHKKTWWNALFANPAGYLPEDSSVELIQLALPYRDILPFGPGWLRGWEVLYFLVLIASSLFVKWRFKIH